VSSNKIIRTLCQFTAAPDLEVVDALAERTDRLREAGYEVQTNRVCGRHDDIAALDGLLGRKGLALSVGRLSLAAARRRFDEFIAAENVSFNVELADEEVRPEHVDLLLDIIATRAEHTFRFGYTFNNATSSPFMPSAVHERDGFAVGLQSTDLAGDATSLDEWLAAMAACWQEIDTMFADEPGYLGIDGSVAPMGTGRGSLVDFVRRQYTSFSDAVTSTYFLTVTDFLKRHNPRPVGLNGLMFPCLEDTELAAEYDNGRFSVERNTFLSLHCGLGLDTYPLGVDERPARILEVLRLVRALSNRYRKPLSVRFVSDGKTRIGERSDFRSPYLTDVTIRAL
jgi:hypothetical protein